MTPGPTLVSRAGLTEWRTAGYLDNPDGVDLTGRHALLSGFAAATRRRPRGLHRA